MMFPPTNPTAERIRHQVEVEEWMKRAQREPRFSFNIGQWFSRILTFRRRPQIALPNVRSTQEVEAC
jgi:hypothetical protein